MLTLMPEIGTLDRKQVATFGGELRLPEKRRYYAVEQRHLMPELEAIKGEQDWPTSMGFKDGVYAKNPDISASSPTFRPRG